MLSLFFNLLKLNSSLWSENDVLSAELFDELLYLLLNDDNRSQYRLFDVYCCDLSNVLFELFFVPAEFE